MVRSYPLDIDPSKCPHCGSDDIRGEAVDVDGYEASQQVCCESCNTSWDEVYGLMHRADTDGVMGPGVHENNKAARMAKLALQRECALEALMDILTSCDDDDWEQALENLMEAWEEDAMFPPASVMVCETYEHHSVAALMDIHDCAASVMFTRYEKLMQTMSEGLAKRGIVVPENTLMEVSVKEGSSSDEVTPTPQIKLRGVADIKTAIAAGHKVHWKNVGYDVIRNGNSENYLINCPTTGGCVGLTHTSGKLNENIDDFFVVMKGDEGE